MQGYRSAAPPHIDVKMGPLPMNVMHFVVPVLIGLLGLAIAGCTVAAVVRGPTPAVLRCTRAASSSVTCEDWRGTPLVVVQRISGELAEVRYYRTPGKNGQDCVVVSKGMACGGQMKANVARIQALAPGQTVDLDATDRNPTMAIVGAMFALIILLLSGIYFATTLARRNVFTIRLTPTTLTVLGKNGLPLHMLMRGRSETVQVAQMRAGRGELPKYEIAYGATEPLTAITSFNAYEYEVAPLAPRLRQALAEMPPAG